jgi:hypothetical protein
MGPLLGRENSRPNDICRSDQQAAHQTRKCALHRASQVLFAIQENWMHPGNKSDVLYQAATMLQILSSALWVFSCLILTALQIPQDRSDLGDVAQAVPDWA